MPIDPQLENLLAALASANLPAFDTLSPVAARQISGALFKAAARGPEVYQVRDLTIPLPRPIHARLYLPAEKTDALVIYFHGGGWVLGNLDSCDSTVRLVAREASTAVLSVDYSLAPEFPFPAAVDEALAVARWAAARLQEFTGGANKIVLGGDSAGANLATVTALALRDDPDINVVFLLLLYPVVDADFDTDSYREFSNAPILTRDLMRWFWNHYLSDVKARSDPRASPLRAPDLSRLPTTLIQTAEMDPLRSEGEAFAARLEAAGVKVSLQRRIGLTHAFAGMAGSVDAAREALMDACRDMRETIAGAASRDARF